ncbi:MAG: membrane protein insertase YidC, partial [Candidatus Binatia bacterium]
MEKRAFIAILLSLIILVAWQEWMSRYYPPPPEPQPPAEQQAQKGRPAEQAPAPPPAAPAAAPSAPAPPVTAQAAKEITVETDDYLAVFTTQGARLKSYQFKHYRTDADPQSPHYELINSGPGVPLPLGLR